MNLDLREDAMVFRAELTRKVEGYAARAGKSPHVPRVSAVEIGYEFAQAGWLIVHFDTRPKHDRDGEWTSFNEKDLLLRPKWFDLVEALDYFRDDPSARKPARLTLADGRDVDTRGISEDEYSAALGEMLESECLRAKADGLFAKLPLAHGAQLDIEEFNGTWAWPERYEDLGKNNLI